MSLGAKIKEVDDSFRSLSTNRNGRVNILSESPASGEYRLYENNNSSNDHQDVASEALYGIQQTTPFSIAFFSEQNQTILQNAIRKSVWEKTQFLIDNQDPLQLQLIMRSIFLQYSVHQPDHIPEQIQRLNDMVLEYSIHRVLTNLQQYLTYKEDVSHLPIPLEYGTNVSKDRHKSLEYKPFI